MKTPHSLCILFVLLSCNISFAQLTPAIITDWTDYAGISDTLTVIPVVKDDSANVISVGVMMMKLQEQTF
ncbi:MAG: hypothetical protein ABI763_14990 [Bacteroidota bacterium]